MDVPTLLANALRSSDDRLVAADALEAGGYAWAAAHMRKALAAEGDAAEVERRVELARSSYTQAVYLASFPEVPAAPRAPAGWSAKTAAAVRRSRSVYTTTRSRAFTRRGY